MFRGRANKNLWPTHKQSFDLECVAASPRRHESCGALRTTGVRFRLFFLDPPTFHLVVGNPLALQEWNSRTRFSDLIMATRNPVTGLVSNKTDGPFTASSVLCWRGDLVGPLN